jgi:RPA family protein|tara:strand:+ start:54 stop:239 length:186 start_codon:yes stop_codon:yes gene_type:complete
MKVGDKVKMLRDIPSINGMLYVGSVVKIDEITEGKSLVRGAIRVVDTLGKIWWVNKEDING